MPTNHQLTPVDAELSVCIPNYNRNFLVMSCGGFRHSVATYGTPLIEIVVPLSKKTRFCSAGRAARRLQSAGSMGWLLTECITQPAWSDPPVYFQTNFYTSGHW